MGIKKFDPTSSDFLPSVGALIVVYQPDWPRLQELVRCLVSQVRVVVLVNNDDLPIEASEFFLKAGAISSFDCLKVLNLGGNLGVATALNKGVEYLISQQCTLAWSFDQDSVPAVDALENLTAAWSGAQLAALAPAIYQEDRDRFLPFLIIDSTAAVSAENIVEPQEVAAAITSGLLFRIDVWQSTGGALDSLFIDHVDTEWCFRARAAGWRIVAVPRARINHQLGQPGPRFAWRWGPHVIQRPPLRTYYMLRNGWLLGRMAHVPLGWKTYQRAQAGKIIAVALLHGPQRWQQLLSIIKALRDACARHPGFGE